MLELCIFVAGAGIGSAITHWIKDLARRRQDRQAQSARLTHDLVKVESYFKNTPGWHSFAEAHHDLENYLMGTSDQARATLRVALDVLVGDGTLERKLSGDGIVFDVVQFRWAGSTQEITATRENA